MKLQKAEFVYKMVQKGFKYEDIAHVIKTKKLNMPSDNFSLKTYYAQYRDSRKCQNPILNSYIDRLIEQESKSEKETWQELYGEQERTMDWKVKFACNDPECDSLYSRDIKMHDGHAHYGQRRCLVCDKHIKWIPFPTL